MAPTTVANFATNKMQIGIIANNDFISMTVNKFESF